MRYKALIAICDSAYAANDGCIAGMQGVSLTFWSKEEAALFHARYHDVADTMSNGMVYYKNPACDKIRIQERSRATHDAQKSISPLGPPPYMKP